MDLQPSHSPPDYHHSQNLHVFLPSSIFIKKELRFLLSFCVLIIFAVVVSSLVSPFDPQFLFRFGLLSQFLPSNSKSSPGPCDYSHGKWVRDEGYQLLSYTENCPFLDPGFRCSQNGRKDDDYRKWRWQPDGCDLPRSVCLHINTYIHTYVCVHVCMCVTPCILLLWKPRGTILFRPKFKRIHE